jgi:hypothetical protein
MKIKITEKQLKKIVNLNEQGQGETDNIIDPFIKLIFDKVRQRMGKKIDSEDGNSSEDSNSETSYSGPADFKKMTELVINKFEGGYYNPKWHFKSAMGDSGETMFGIDRKHGGTLNTSGPGQEFWSLIDKNKTKNSWRHGFRGGELESKLTDLVVKIMEPHFKNLSEKYLNEKSRNIVNSDKGLLLHFIYASWNGPGFFQKFAKDINSAVDSGITSSNELREIAINSRKKTSLGSSNKMENLIKSMS